MSETSIRMEDGVLLATANTPKGQESLALFQRICTEADRLNAQWVLDLRLIGIKAAHPDDGWVDRKRSDHQDYVTLVYPQFNDGLDAGDLIALGWRDQYRVRRVVRVDTRLGGTCKVYVVTK